jgi:hypothetical protein
MCPAICDQCFPNNTCRIGAMAGEVVQCPPDYACEVLCGDCTDTVVECPTDYACKLVCFSPDGCDTAEVNCGDASCTIECDPGGSGCDGATVHCGPGPCGVVCAGVPGLPTVECGESCDCTEAC